jgi:hypothetical protein
MTPRQAHALAHPLATASGDITSYREVRRHARGFLLVTVLAVDR